MGTHPLSFLQSRDAALFRLYVQAERLSTEDPAAACVHLRRFAESVVWMVCGHEGLSQPLNLNDGIDALRRHGVSSDAVRWLDELRRLGNRAAHEPTAPPRRPRRALSASPTAWGGGSRRRISAPAPPS